MIKGGSGPFSMPGVHLHGCVVGTRSKSHKPGCEMLHSLSTWAVLGTQTDRPTDRECHLMCSCFPGHSVCRLTVLHGGEHTHCHPRGRALKVPRTHTHDREHRA